MGMGQRERALTLLMPCSTDLVLASGESADGMTSQDALMVVYLSNLTRTQISIAESQRQNQQQSDQ